MQGARRRRRAGQLQLSSRNAVPSLLVLATFSPSSQFFVSQITQHTSVWLKGFTSLSELATTVAAVSHKLIPFSRALYSRRVQDLGLKVGVWGLGSGNFNACVFNEKALHSYSYLTVYSD